MSLVLHVQHYFQMCLNPVDLEAVSSLLSHGYMGKKKQAAVSFKRGFVELDLPTPQPSDSDSDDVDLPLRKRLCLAERDCDLARVSALQ